jgi:hypothetical protein
MAGAGPPGFQAGAARISEGAELHSGGAAPA